MDEGSDFGGLDRGGDEECPVGSGTVYRRSSGWVGEKVDWMGHDLGNVSQLDVSVGVRETGIGLVDGKLESCWFRQRSDACTNGKAVFHGTFLDFVWRNTDLDWRP